MQLFVSTISHPREPGGENIETHDKKKRRERELERADDPRRLGLGHVEVADEDGDGGEERRVVERIEELREAEDEQQQVPPRGRVLLWDAPIDECLRGREHCRGT